MARWFRHLPAAFYLILAYVFIFLPVVILVLFSFQDGQLPVPPFDGPSLRWYERMISDSRLVEALGHSVIVALLSSLVATLLGFLAAYALARRNMPFGGGIRYLLMAPLTVSYLIIGMGLLITFALIGIPKSLLAVGIGHVVINLPLCFAIVYSQMGEHQRNIERAAQDLGANDLQTLVLITIPILQPALFASFCLAATLSWDEFIIAFLLTRFDVTLPVIIFEMLSAGLNPVLNAAGTVVFAISILFVLLALLLATRRKRANVDAAG
ncbi:MAG: ABC transporter permease [Hyphomicrobiales bacterium]|nr:ABC transporter permease [Hyphomicrobiales bacterium]